MIAMPKGLDVAYVLYQVPDLDKMESFMTDFGLTRAARTADALYMRGAGPAPFLHGTLRGETPRFVGGAFRVGSAADLEALAKTPGASAIEPVDGPGGGQRVRMTMPDGARIDAVFGAEDAPPLAFRSPNPFNTAERKERKNASLRPRREACPVLRLGHFVLRVTDHDASVRWLQERFGLLASDHIADGERGKVVGTFLRCDRGAELVDHHVMLIVESKDPGVHHCSFEVQDIDSIMGAHDYLVDRGYRLDCGVGRHLLGSQIFDYWRDPFGFRVEHYTDGDVVNHEFVPSTFTGTADQTTQWGMNPPREFFD